MLNTAVEWMKESEGILERLRQLSPIHMIVAYRAKMTNFEILRCQEISIISKLPLLDVLEKMALFKQTSEYILYKKDFAFG